MKKIHCLLPMLLAVLLLLSSCTQEKQTVPQKQPNDDADVVSSTYTKYSVSYFDTFDTLITITAYASDQETFDAAASQMHQLYITMHQLYDNYNAYPGVNNVYTLNHTAAEKPVEVDPLLFNLLKLCKQKQPLLHSKVNIAMGSVLKIWHDYREAGLNDPENAQVPSMDTLTQAAEHVNFDLVELNEDANTVYFTDPQLQLDLGAVAKGYTTEIVAQELIASGLSSFVISAGGNVRAGHAPLDGRTAWGIGVQNPEGIVLSSSTDDLIDVLYLCDTSVVTSGDYQRYYTVDGVRYHHLIDPDTLMPGDYFPSVTIVTNDSGLADLLSTAVFLMPYEEGYDFVNSLEDVEALWIFKDGSTSMTPGLETFAKSHGASSR